MVSYFYLPSYSNRCSLFCTRTCEKEKMSVVARKRIDPQQASKREKGSQAERQRERESARQRKKLRNKLMRLETQWPVLCLHETLRSTERVTHRPTVLTSQPVPIHMHTSCTAERFPCLVETHQFSNRMSNLVSSDAVRAPVLVTHTSARRHGG